MPPAYQLTHKALDDFDGIWTYIALTALMPQLG
jgi:plasmid stabilization system protein ParE